MENSKILYIQEKIYWHSLLSMGHLMGNKFTSPTITPQELSLQNFRAQNLEKKVITYSAFITTSLLKKNPE